MPVGAYSAACPTWYRGPGWPSCVAHIPRSTVLGSGLSSGAGNPHRCSIDLPPVLVILPPLRLARRQAVPMVARGSPGRLGNRLQADPHEQAHKQEHDCEHFNNHFRILQFDLCCAVLYFTRHRPLLTLELYENPARQNGNSTPICIYAYVYARYLGALCPGATIAALQRHVILHILV